MQTHTKHRLLGLGVFVSMAALFFPILIHHTARPSNFNLLSEIPPSLPSEPRMVLNLPLEKGTLVSERMHNETQSDSTSHESNEIQKIPIPKALRQLPGMHAPSHLNPLSNPSPKAWVIQIGTFRDKKHVEKLVKSLRAKNYLVYTRTDSNPRLIRVYIGPEIHKNKLGAIQQHIQQQFHLKGVIKNYHYE